MNTTWRHCCGILATCWILLLCASAPAAADESPLFEHEEQKPLSATATDPQDGFQAELDKAEAELHKKTRSSVGAFASAFTDQNKITILHGGGFFTAVPANELDLHVQIMTGHIHQAEKDARPESNLWRTSVEVGADDFFLTPQVVLWASALYEQFDTLNNDPGDNDATAYTAAQRRSMYRSYLAGGKLGAKYLFENGSEIGVEGKRESIWSEHNKYDVRLFNRVVDMTQLRADMAINKARGFVDLVTLPEQQLRLEGGLDSFEDGNLRGWGYAHYQIPVLWSRDNHWTAIRPNFYLESVQEEKPAYFSPQRHTTLGVMLHTIQDFEHFDVEAEVNPQLLWTRDETKTGETATGIHGLLSLAYKTDSFRIGVGGFGYTDSDGYWLLRSTLFLRYFF